MYCWKRPQLAAGEPDRSKPPGSGVLVLRATRACDPENKTNEATKARRLNPRIARLWLLSLLDLGYPKHVRFVVAYIFIDRERLRRDARSRYKLVFAHLRGRHTGSV